MLWLFWKAIGDAWNMILSYSYFVHSGQNPWTRCGHKCSPFVRAQHLLWTQICVRDTKKCFVRNILCPRQMFPSLRICFVSRLFAYLRNIHLRATMCPCLLLALTPNYSLEVSLPSFEILLYTCCKVERIKLIIRDGRGRFSIQGFWPGLKICELVLIDVQCKHA